MASEDTTHLDVLGLPMMTDQAVEVEKLCGSWSWSRREKGKRATINSRAWGGNRHGGQFGYDSKR